MKMRVPSNCPFITFWMMLMKSLFQRWFPPLQTTTFIISLVAWGHWKCRNYFPFFFLDRTRYDLILSILRNHSLIIFLSSYTFSASYSFLFSRSSLISWWRGRLNMNGLLTELRENILAFLGILIVGSLAFWILLLM